MTRVPLLLTVAALVALVIARGPAHALPAQAGNFQLVDHAGNAHELFRQVDAAAVVIVPIATDCAQTAAAAEALGGRVEAFADRGIVFLALNPSPDASRDATAEWAATVGLDVPVLLDPSQTVARSLGATHSGQALVIMPAAEWAIAHRGSMHPDALGIALDAVLAGDTPDDGPAAAGTAIAFAVDQREISFQHDIAPILAEKCITCHHDGGIGPFAMSSLRRVRGWAPMMAETILTERMPPWHADPYHGDYRNTLGLSTEERALLLAWLEAGTPDDLDGAPDPIAAAADAFDDDWALGEPDLIVSMFEQEELPAEGVIDYRYRYIPSGLTEDKWVRAVEVKAGNPSVVHHALIFILYPKEYRHLQPDARGGLNGYFAAFLPGAAIEPFPNGSAQWVPAGSTFVFQMHYTVTGRPETDLTRMGLYFADEQPQYEFRMAGANNTRFEIPPQTTDFPTTASYRFDDAVTLWAASPHMHYRGSRFRFEVRPPDASPFTVLSVPRFDFNWQPLYFFEEPVPVPAGTTIFCEGAFDNSPLNPMNPDPDATVRFGEQSFEEMFIGYLGYTLPSTATVREPLPAERIARMGMGEPITAENLVGTTWRLGDRVELRFLDEGRVIANNMLPGTWELINTRLLVQNAMRPIELAVVGDELIVMGRSLRFVREGDDDTGEAATGDRRSWRERRDRDGETPGQGRSGGEPQRVSSQAN